ncbi:flagellar motor switch phosphatase FliY [Salimicrobium jeotgali]|uniref:Flagellar motor switch phosphatase FliY n=1 Tax=Salimicrobium jeotgali TaxID=1230341 RepID=K2FPI3_9BACI|nr:flagellar motor switch phosphatase FliY [Salimicrobium jeotgali]AKG04566.1 flagellar motor switch phosphatase FliY [Salimicrobium jeotgali]EKE32781.1 flagellar motor switch protein [Salimicrobium jeotgali]MBM7695231.1 flagellar motor switch protein FliN/FliY [Salimicrobium jeotgali]
MKDDMLSQDEIDALLNESDDEEVAENVVNDEEQPGLSEVEKDTLGEIGNISFGNSTTALSALLNQKVQITTPETTTILRKELEDTLTEPYVAVLVTYTSGISGDNLLVLKVKDAAIIADLMLGGDGTSPKEELGDIHLSAVQEAMNQMMGSAATSMSSMFRTRIDISPPEITMLDIDNKIGVDYIPTEDLLTKISFRLKIGEVVDSEIMQLLPVDFSKGLVEQLMSPENEQEQRNENRSNSTAKYSDVKKPAAHEQNPEETASFSSAENGKPQMLGRHSTGESHAESVEFENFHNHHAAPSGRNNLDMLLDIPLNVTVELGRTKRSIREILDLSSGSILELDKLAGEPVEIFVNEKLMATGEVVVIDENFGVRVTDILSQQDRLKKLR